MAARETLSLAYTGPALAAGEMDVRELAPALLAAAGFIEESARVLFGERMRVNVQVSATRKGSFDIDLVVVASFWSNMVDFLNGDTLSALKTLGELTLGGGSVLAVIQWLKNRKGRTQAIGDGMVRIEIDGDSIVVPSRALELARDARVRAEAEKMTRPLEREGIDGLEVRAGHGREPVVRIDASDRPAMQLPPVGERLVVEETRQMALGIVSLTFKENNKWRMSDGASQFYVTIEDDVFLRRVDENLEQFSKDDFLVCRVRVRAYATGKGLRTDYVIEEVIEHQSAAQQLDLGLSEESTPG